MRVSFGRELAPVVVEFPDFKSAELFAGAFAPGFKAKPRSVSGKFQRSDAVPGLSGRVCQSKQAVCDADYRLSRLSNGWNIETGAGDVLAEGKRFDQAVGLLDAEFEKRLRNMTSPTIASLHSCGILTPAGAVELLGISGSGKTTLGLACAASGICHLGDEFGFVDLETGLSWHAEYPIGIKRELYGLSRDKDSGPFLGLTPSGEIEGLQCESAFGIKSTLYSREALEECTTLRFCRPDVHRHLRAMVSVSRRKDATPSLVALPLSTWVKEIMPSIDADLTRQEVFSKLIYLSSGHDVEFLRLVYFEAIDGVALLLRRFGARHGYSS